MSRKNLLFVTASIFVIFIFAIVFMLLSSREKSVTPPLGEQNPIFGGSSDVFPIDKPRDTVTDSQIPVTSGDAALIASCDSSITIERDDCIKKIAVGSGKSSLCAAILGTFGKTDCERAVSGSKESIVDISAKSTTRYEFDYSSKTPVADPFVSSATQKLGEIFDRLQDARNEALANPDNRFTTEGFYERFRSGAKLTLYAFSAMQAAPGSEIVAQGMGFEETGNDIYIGGHVVSNVSSADGATMKFTVPASLSPGVYEAWIVNKRGTSKDPSREIRLTISNNPLPSPVITRVSPAVPTLSDTVTLYGSSLNGASGLYTSLGVAQNISASDSTISFNLGDLELVKKIKDMPDIKGKLVSISVIVATPQGYNQEMFTFNVQF